MQAQYIPILSTISPLNFSTALSYLVFGLKGYQWHSFEFKIFVRIFTFMENLGSQTVYIQRPVFNIAGFS